jgi:16S rRNA (guanine527-N7)-methyltransferase
MLENILISGARSLDIDLNEDKLSSFRRYYEFLEEKNRVMNLTAISGEDDVAHLHFLDSLAVTKFCAFKDAKVIDIGSGAGFPGLPIKISGDGVSLTLLDAQKKRVDFLTGLCGAIGAQDVKCIHARAEEAALLPEFRDGFDIAVSRAVARLNVLCELCLPFVRPGGIFAAMKSVDTEEETDQAKSAVKSLGAAITAVKDYVIPGTDVTHRIILMKKLSPTPKGLPRRFAKIQKTPL